MKKVKLWVQHDDMEVGLLFTWDPVTQTWSCYMSEEFMQELGPLPVDDTLEG